MQGEGLEYGEQDMDEEIREREMARVWQEIWNEEKRKLEKYFKNDGDGQIVSAQPNTAPIQRDETAFVKITRGEGKGSEGRDPRPLEEEEGNKREAITTHAGDQQMNGEKFVQKNRDFETPKKLKGSIIQRVRRHIGRFFREFCCCAGVREESS
jgi:hypothetical protein